jgi:hypothetical protein
MRIILGHAHITTTQIYNHLDEAAASTRLPRSTGCAAPIEPALWPAVIGRLTGGELAGNLAARVTVTYS